MGIAYSIKEGSYDQANRYQETIYPEARILLGFKEG